MIETAVKSDLFVFSYGIGMNRDFMNLDLV